MSQPDSTMNRAFIFGSLLIVMLAASLRVYHIGTRSVWLDEAIAANVSRGTLAQTLTLTRGLHSAPILDPLILYTVEKVGSGPLAVRVPSFLASVLAVILMLCFVTIPSIDFKTAGLSALMLAVSAAQIRYAQEVREYSLSVLYAGVLLYLFLSYASKEEKHDSPISLYLALFVAPFVQYGLVLFSFGVVSALVILDFAGGKRGRRIAQIITASGCLAAGGLLSFLLTLRYQWGEDAWYLKDYFFAPGSNLWRFVLSNTHHLITFLLPGLVAAAISTVAIVIDLAETIRKRIVLPLAVLAFTSCGIVLACSILRVYPYGGIRQCLFLAPVLCLFASASLVQFANRFVGHANSIVFGAIVCVVVVSGGLQIRLLKPYAEVEDIQMVLNFLRSNLEPGDNVYVYPGAVPAVDFYVKQRDSRFLYEDFHQQAPEQYAQDVRAGVSSNCTRLWIVFSHVYRDEDQRILHDLSVDWNVAPEVSVKGSALYLASRKPGVAVVSSVQSDGTDSGQSTLMAARTHSSFWDWNVRNSRQSAR